MFFISVFVGCKIQDRQPAPAEIRVGVLPDEAKPELIKHYTPLLEYISKESHLNLKLIVPQSYAELISLFRQNKIDLAYFGGYTFVLASQQGKIEPLVMRDIDTHFVTYFVAKSGRSEKKISDFRNRIFTFGNRDSTSGHLMARNFLVRQGIFPESYFSEVKYTTSHDQTIALIRSGGADLGAVNSAIYNAMLLDGRLKKDVLKVVHESPPYSDYVWAVHSTMPENLKIKIRDAFLNLTAENPEHRQILGWVSAKYFVPAAPSQFSELEEIVNGHYTVGTKDVEN